MSSEPYLCEQCSFPKACKAREEFHAGRPICSRWFENCDMGIPAGFCDLPFPRDCETCLEGYNSNFPGSKETKSDSS